MTKDEISLTLIELHTELQNILGLAKQGLLKNERHHETVQNTYKKLKEIKLELGEIEQLKIERIIPMWTNEVKTGIFLNENQARKPIDPLIELLTELIGVVGGSIPSKDIFIVENSQYEGRKILRSIFNRAHKKILLVDGYLRPEILEVLQLNLVDYPNLELQFLTQKNNNRFFKTFSTDVAALSAQYTKAVIEFKYYDNLPPHDRYVVIDGKTIFHSGHSFAELGNRASNINEIEGDAYSSAKSNIDDLWLSGLK